MSKKQGGLFKQEETKEDWEKEWEGMPEFIQEDLTSKCSVLVHFKSEEDMELFSELIGQKLTTRSRGIWYPQLDIRRYADKRYVDES